MSISHELAELVLNTSGNDIPDSCYRATERMLIDTIACAYAGRHAPGISEILDLERVLSANGDGTVFFSDKKLSLPSAAFCNSAMIHAMDLDNNYPGADIHILSIVVPVAVACAEASQKSGRDFLNAIILGVEAAARIAKPYIKAKRNHSYFLTTSLVGGWGGVAAAARLLDLSVLQTINAMGIYYAHTCGNRQALLDKSLTKRIQPAIAARGALYSVMLAPKGFTGPEHTFEGAGGFYNCYTLDPPPKPEIFHNHPNVFGIEELVIKKYPTCGIHHPCIESALYLKNKYQLQYADIEKVEFFLQDGGRTLVSMPFSEGNIPQISAQFCAPYAIALALTKGQVNPKSFTNESILRDKETIDLAQRTVELTNFTTMKLINYPEAKPGCKYLKIYLKDHVVLEHEYSDLELRKISTGEISFLQMKLHQSMEMYDDVNAESASQIVTIVKKLFGAKNIAELISLLGKSS